MGVWKRYREIRAERKAKEKAMRERFKPLEKELEKEALQVEGKSRGTAMILALLFGPLGLLYVSPAAAILLTIVAIVGAATIAVPIAVWIISIGLADHYAYTHNRKIKAKAKMMSKVIGAVKE